MSVEILNPPLPEWERQKTRNDDSLVLRVRYGKVELLLTGDIGSDVEHRLVAALKDDGAWLRVLKVAHHGSRTSSSGEMVETFDPVAALVSVGRFNTFGHPAPEVIARFERAGTRVFRSDRDGAVIVETDGREVRARTMGGASWRAQAESSAPAP